MPFLDDPFIFTQSDRASSNFALDKGKRIYMFDFRDVGVTAGVLRQLYARSGYRSLYKQRGGVLGVDRQSQQSSITRVGAVLKTTGDSTLGTSASTLIYKIHTDIVGRSRYARHSQGPTLAFDMWLSTSSRFAILDADSVSYAGDRQLK